MEPQLVREYDIFERVNGDLIWRTSISGQEAALNLIKDMAAKSPSEFVLMHLATSEVIATLNAFSSQDTGGSN